MRNWAHGLFRFTRFGGFDGKGMSSLKRNGSRFANRESDVGLRKRADFRGRKQKIDGGYFPSRSRPPQSNKPSGRLRQQMKPESLRTGRSGSTASMQPGKMCPKKKVYAVSILSLFFGHRFHNAGLSGEEGLGPAIIRPAKKVNMRAVIRTTNSSVYHTDEPHTLCPCSRGDICWRIGF